ncbi:hypothetical protein V6N11_078374 [Hibiscus sabdariffa]|uniref:Uncharacterized protein n=1 Tax=Hibiscus sabdariffa TaxID=183260 RepID=A0ABR2TFV8_9ROSI
MLLAMPERELDATACQLCSVRDGIVAAACEVPVGGEGELQIISASRGSKTGNGKSKGTYLLSFVLFLLWWLNES